MQCPQCQHENPAEAKFCLHCGTRLAQVCSQCRQALPPEAKFCMACGHALPAPSANEPQDRQPAQVESTPTTQHTPEAERRQLTVLFCDLVGSTQLSAQLDPEDLRDVIQSYQQTAAEVIAHYDGYIAQYLGDGLLVYFGYPQAHEEDAQRAVRASLDLLEAMAPLNTQLMQTKSIQLSVRMGIHTGLAVVGSIGGGDRQEQLALGETPNIAARLEGLAQSNQIVVSASTRRLLGQAFDLEDLGTHTLKGVADPFQVYGIVGEHTGESRFEASTDPTLTPLVGREEEIGLILQRWEQAKAGEGQMVFLSGEPGIGKSRSIQAMIERLADEPHLSMRFQCSPYHTSTAFYPITEQFAIAAGFNRDDTAEHKLDKLETHLEQVGLVVAEVAPLFAAALSIPTGERYASLEMSPQQQKDRTISALSDRLLATASQQPLLFIAEDLHWSDPSSLETIGRIIEMIPNARILMICTHRPELVLPWGGNRLITLLSLNRLSRSQSADLATRLTAGKRLPPEVVDQILTKSDGIPLFIEEVTKSLLESDWLEEKERHYELAAPLSAMAIPSTLQGALMSRLDHLAEVKELAQIGATIGREFSYELLREVASVEEGTLKAGMEQLVHSELCYQRGEGPDAVYIFKHALIQDAAYQSLLKRSRQHYHQRIAELLASQFPETVASHPEVMAHHYTAAECPELAIDAWHQAGRRALERSENLEAIAHLTQGLRLLPALAETPSRLQHEFALQAIVGPAFMATQGYASTEAEQAFRRALEVGRQVASAVQLYPVLRGLWAFYAVQADYHRAQELEQEIYPIAEQADDPVLLSDAHFTLAYTRFYLGDLRAARSQFEQGIEHYDPDHHAAHVALYGQNTSVFCLAQLSWPLVLLGYPEQAAERSGQALTLGQELSHPYTLSGALGYASGMHQIRRDVGATQAQAEAAIALCNEQGFAMWRSIGLVFHGWTLAEQGQAQQGITQIREGIDNWKETGSKVHLSHLLALLAAAYAKADQTELGLATVAEALDFIDRSNERFYEAELYRLKGQFMRSPTIGDQAEAEACFHQALDSARDHNAKFLELRAATSFAHLWQSQGKLNEARELLVPVYEWFTEGFDTADLQDAKALLDALAR